MGSKKPPKTEVVVAIIGLIGVLGAAVIANWEKIFSPRPGPNNNVPVNRLTPQPLITDPETCLTRFLQGVPKDRLSTLETGANDQQIIGPDQSKDQPIALRLEESRKFVGVVGLQFYSSNTIFKIDSIVDSGCQPIESFRNSTRDGDKRVLQNYDYLEIQFKSGTYSLRFDYDAGRIDADFTRVSPP